MPSRFIERLHEGAVVYGTGILSTCALWPGAVKSCNLDFVFLDSEHIPLNRSELAQQCQIYRSMGIAPLVRIFNQDAHEACKALDGGAAGVIVPYLEEPEKIRQLIAAVKWRPLKGQYLNRYSRNPAEMPAALSPYLQQRNQETVFIANIESMPAVHHLNEILALPGLDGIFIGPHDLSCSMGLPEQYEHPDFEQVVKTIIHQARARNVAIGIHFSESPQQQIRWLAEGVTIVIHSSDISLFRQALAGDLAIIQSAAALLPERN
ncbi:MAG TPA: aldolase/citrate lyase family protein [bacterium]|nr:aldolase/citrate lyase family protein [bacterium]HPN32971.1 aldolase/citrate lyase family protein [bacterium]